MSYLVISGGALIVLILSYFLRHILGGLFGLYRIVPPNEAHVRILKNKKDIFSHRTQRSSYWVIPFITKVNRLPISNLTIPVNDIKLNDKNMAKFVCDIVCFVNIKDLELASERLLLSDAEKDMGFDFVKLSEDFRSIMESVGRTVVTKQTILDIYMNRQALSIAITHEVEGVFPKWGIELVNLELKHIKDFENSTIIADIERKVAAEIRRDADIKVSETNREAEMAKAVNDEAYRKRQIQRDREIGIAEQDKNMEISRKKAEANLLEVEAMRKLEVGRAEISKQMVEQQSQAQKIKYEVEAQGQSNQINSIGEAEANIIKIKKVAEAEGTLKLAEAMKQFNDVAINVKVLDIQKDVLIAKFNALSSAMQKADIKWIISGANAQKFFGINLDAEGGANFKQFLEESDVDLNALKKFFTKEAKVTVESKEKKDPKDITIKEL
jgi:flotillin